MLQMGSLEDRLPVVGILKRMLSFACFGVQKLAWNARIPIGLGPTPQAPSSNTDICTPSCLAGAGGLLGAALFRHHKAIPSLLTLLLHCKGGEKAADQALSLLFPVFHVKAWFSHTRMASKFLRHLE